MILQRNMVDRIQTHTSRECEEGIRMKMPSARTTAYFLGSRGAVGTAGWGHGRFRLVITGFFRQPRTLTSEP